MTAHITAKRSGPGKKIALAQVGGVQLELVQAVDGPSIYGDWIKERGEGIHHMNFLVDDVDETVESWRKEGFPSLQSGKFGPREKRGRTTTLTSSLFARSGNRFIMRR